VRYQAPDDISRSVDESTFYQILLFLWLVLAAVTFVALFFVTAPYGRFQRSSWGWAIQARWGWVAMEVPALLSFVVLYLISDRRGSAVSMLLLILWTSHYAHRSLIYPFRLGGNRSSMNLPVITLGACFNVGNGYLNARYLFTIGPELSPSWLLNPRFILGLLLFLVGFTLNYHSDRVLARLRRRSQAGGYAIPLGGAYRFVSCPNYLGEIVEWGGWALVCSSAGSIAFLLWTAANLVPRAIRTHHWYRDNFEDYPSRRKALLPFIV